MALSQRAAERFQRLEGERQAGEGLERLLETTQALGSVATPASPLARSSWRPSGNDWSPRPRPCRRPHLQPRTAASRRAAARTGPVVVVFGRGLPRVVAGAPRPCSPSEPSWAWLTQRDPRFGALPGEGLARRRRRADGRLRLRARAHPPLPGPGAHLRRPEPRRGRRGGGVGLHCGDRCRDHVSARWTARPEHRLRHWRRPNSSRSGFQRPSRSRRCAASPAGGPAGAPQALQALLTAAENTSLRRLAACSPSCAPAVLPGARPSTLLVRDHHGPDGRPLRERHPAGCERAEHRRDRPAGRWRARAPPLGQGRHPGRWRWRCDARHRWDHPQRPHRDCPGIPGLPT